jgi:CheY-like chemotaxis protein
MDELWAEIDEWVPDAIITDYSLGSVEGHVVIDRLRACQGFADVPIGAMSAHVDSEVERKCRAAGAEDYLRKPFGVDELTAFVGRLAPLSLQAKSRATGPVSRAARLQRPDPAG